MLKLTLVGIVGIAVGAIVTFGVMAALDDGSPAQAAAGPAQYEVLSKGITFEGDKGMVYIRYQSYGEAQEWRGALVAKDEPVTGTKYISGYPQHDRDCFKAASIGRELPAACR